MKKTFILICSLSCLNVVAQKDTTKADTSYIIVLKKPELDWLINVIKTQDEKPSTINAQIQAIIQKTQMILPPKEKPKK